MKRMLASAAFGVLALMAAGCGSGSSSNGAAAGSTSAGMSTMVSVKHVDGVGNVLVDSKGMALYSPEQEAGGKVLCTGPCTSIWVPLTLSGSMKPTGASEVRGNLGTTDRPDGAVQITYKGKPLYTFVEDTSPGTVTGNDFSDQFGGQQFLWRVAAVGPVSGTNTNTSTGLGY
jgi:predicted lipoprotein with Yx(FWY)xxD motif